MDVKSDWMICNLETGDPDEPIYEVFYPATISYETVDGVERRVIKLHEVYEELRFLKLNKDKDEYPIRERDPEVPLAPDLRALAHRRVDPEWIGTKKWSCPYCNMSSLTTTQSEIERHMNASKSIKGKPKDPDCLERRKVEPKVNGEWKPAEQRPIYN